MNCSQSSNDVFPTSVHVAVTGGVVEKLLPALAHLAESLEAKAEAWKSVVKSGRTHLMDATPVTLGQEFGGYAAAIRYGIERVEAALPRTAEVPQGGTAVGTGINTPVGFPQKVISGTSPSRPALPLTEARNHFEAQSARDGLVEMSGALRTIAVCPSRRSATTCAGWARVPTPVSARSRSPTCSPAPRSCPAR